MATHMISAAASWQRFPATHFAEPTSAERTPYGLPLADDALRTTLRNNKFSRTLSQESLDAVDRIQHTMSYPEGALILVEGQVPRGVFILCQGRAKLLTTHKDGKTFIVKIAEPGDILGLHSIVSGKPCELTMETLQPSQLAFIGREDFLRFLKEHPDACLHAAQQVAHDCQSAYEVIRSVGLSHSVSEKLARLVLRWAMEGRVSAEGIRLKLSLTHEEIAQLVGTSRETVTRLMGEFKKQRVLELKGSTLLIRNLAALKKLVEF